MKSLQKNYIYSMLDQVLLFFVPLVLVPYTSRTLGADNLGIYSYIYSIATVFSTCGRLGINTYGKLCVSQYRDDPQKRNTTICELMTLKFILTGVELVLYILVVSLLNKYHTMCMIMIVYLVSDFLDVTWLYQGLENFKIIAIRGFFVKALTLTLVLLFVHNTDDLYLYTLIMQGSALLTNGFLLIGIRKYISSPYILANENTAVHLKKCLVYFIPTIANLIYNVLDKVMLGYLGGSTLESGYYEQAYKIINVAHVVVLAIGTVTLPRLAYIYASGQKDVFKVIVKRAIGISIMLLLPMSVGLYVNADIIVRSVLGEEFRGSIKVLKVLSMLLFFGSLNYNLGNQLLVSTERQRQFNIAVLVGAGVNFICNLLLIRKYYAVGAAIGSLAAEVVIFCIMLVVSRAVLPIRDIIPASLWKYVVSCGVMVVWDLFVRGRIVSMGLVLQLLFVIGSSAALYFGVLLCLGERELLSTFKKLLKSK